MLRKSHLVLAALATAVAVSFIAAPPALATRGSEAAAACSARPDCRFGVGSNGDIVIFVDGHVIWCDGVDGDCIVVTRPNFSDRAAGERADTVLGTPGTANPSPPPVRGPAPAVRDHRRN
jgi:hypothetical protein